MAASKITDDDQQRGLLQYIGGDDVQRLVPTISNTGASLADLCKAVQEQLDKHQNKTLLRYTFRQLHQQPDDTLEGFSCRLGDGVKRSGFPDDDAEKLTVLDQLIIGCKSDALRRKLLEIDNLDLDKALKAARAYEASISHVPGIKDASANPPSEAHIASLVAPASSQVASVDALSTRRSGPQSTPPTQTCYRCGQPGHATCNAADGKFCNRCGKANHFAAACRATDADIQSRRGRFTRRRPPQAAEHNLTRSTFWRLARKCFPLRASHQQLAQQVLHMKMHGV